MDVFISYSHKDRVWKDRVATFMQCMKQQGHFEFATWDDGEISASQDWGNVIQDAINKAKVAVLLVSPDFLCSQFINKVELNWLLSQREEGKLNVVPVIVRPCPWEVVEWLAPIQLHPSDGTALSRGSEHQIEEHLKQLVLEVDRLITQTRTDTDTEASIEDEMDTTSLTTSPPTAYQFLEEEEVRELIREKGGGETLETLLLFRTKTQRTWLVTTRGALYCVLDSQNTSDADRLVQWEMNLQPGTPVHARPRSRHKVTGLIDIGKRQNWLYSLRLHREPSRLETEILEMMKRARRS